MKNVSAIILAAGKGSRMKAPADKNKVVFELGNKPLIQYTYETLKKCGVEDIVVVVGYAAESVKKVLGNRVTYAHQDEPLGTGHAVWSALPAVSKHTDTILCMYGDDSAFYNSALIKTLYMEHKQSGAAMSMITLEKSDPSGLGRIIRNNEGKIQAIIEEKNATLAQKSIKEINSGLYCFNTSFIKKALHAIKKDPISGEYYLTDIVSYALSNNFPVDTILWPNDEIWFGINTPDQLQQAHQRISSNTQQQSYAQIEQ